MTTDLALLIDTQVLIWYVTDPKRLSRVAVEALEEATEHDRPIGVLSYSLVEMIYAAEKARNPFTNEDLRSILDVLEDPESPFEIVSVDAAIAQHVANVPRDDNADPGDRLIVAAAEVLGVPLVSSDRKVPAMTDILVIW